MTIVRLRDLAPEEIQHLGNNIEQASIPSLQSLDAINRSLGCFDEDTDDNLDPVPA